MSTLTKVPSKKSQAQIIFNTKIGEKALYSTNKELRGATLSAFEVQLNVSRASASTMFNSFKMSAEAAGLITLGRDAKKVKAASSGKRGRPVGSVGKKTV